MEFSETHDIELKGTLNEKVEKGIVLIIFQNDTIFHDKIALEICYFKG